jgi:hypothetical protein
MGFNRDLVGLMGFNGDLTNKHGDLIVIEKDFMGKSSMLMLGKQCHKPDHTYGLMVYSTHKNCDDLGMVYETGFTTVHVYSQTVSMDITESHMATTPSYGPRLTAPHLRQEV